ncbi:hypothetical protein Y032_0005g2488 [Ancylostoma ceylanicum]|uniref:Uncharacterized protein n=1 Tax=Ancylostoma ceylanicum TaxID=53326 RepID=A0A016VT00_9BILA|nr:hypothetical protein Y032_0005g2488 [Ancylostoma ceylanicum]
MEETSTILNKIKGPVTSHRPRVLFPTKKRLPGTSSFLRGQKRMEKYIKDKRNDDLEHTKKNVIVRRGEFFEAEERYDKNDEDVIHFDMITNIRRKVDDRGEYYSLTVHRYFCGKIPDTPPDWYLKKNWPFWPEMEAQHVS